MIDIPLWFLLTVVLSALALGFTIGRYLKPTITSKEGVCGIPMMVNPDDIFNPPMTRHFSDQKCFNVTCQFLYGNKKCSYTKRKCDHIASSSCVSFWCIIGSLVFFSLMTYVAVSL